jgi:SAM-dependent methyltransferase
MIRETPWIAWLREFGGLDPHSVVCEFGPGTHGETIYCECMHWFGVGEATDVWRQTLQRLDGRPKVSFVERRPDTPVILPDGVIDIVYTGLSEEEFETNHIGAESERILVRGGRLLWSPAGTVSKLDMWSSRLRGLGFESSEWIWTGNIERPVLLVARVPADSICADVSHQNPFSSLEGALSALTGVGLEVGGFTTRVALRQTCYARYLNVCGSGSGQVSTEATELLDLTEVRCLGSLFEVDLDRVGTAELDFVICDQVLHRLTNLTSLVDSMFRIVRPGGYVVALGPDLSPSFGAASLIDFFEPLSQIGARSERARCVVQGQATGPHSISFVVWQRF